MTKHLLIFLLLTTAAVGGRGISRAQDAESWSKYVSPWRTPWDYEGARGAAHWSELDSDYTVCNTGREQSPIDIRSAKKTVLPEIRFENKSGALKYVINNGHTIRVDYHDVLGKGNFLVVGDKRYQLTQFHFHSPSEEYIEGKTHRMEVHLMYKSSDGKVAGVAVFVEGGSANLTVQKVWDHMPTFEGQEAVDGVEINPDALLPKNHAYYMYMGSLTAPPCTEGVTWFVLKTPIDFSQEQIQAFTKLYPNNARPLQDLNGRIVKEG